MEAPVRFTVDCRLRYEVRTPTTFILAVQAADGADQSVEDENLRLPPGVEPDFYVDAFAGNRFVRFLAQPGHLEIAYHAVVKRLGVVDQRRIVGGGVVADLPTGVLPYLAQSRYCESDRLTAFARDLFGAFPQGLGQVRAISDWIAANVVYEAGTTHLGASATDILIDRRGVCRDFAHLGVALTRALDMPARFVSCYAWRLQPRDFHAAFQVFLDGRWMTFDATGRAPLDGLIPIGFGRDAADVPFAALFGQATLESMRVKVETALEASPEFQSST